MCLLILQERGSTIEEQSLSNAFQANRDGVGYSYIKEDRMVTKKFRDYKKFLKGYNSDIANFGYQSPFLLHFRLTTHGTNKGTFNVHPFKVREGLMFAHNGVISDVDDDKKLSDTQVFNRDILQKLPTNFLMETAMIKLIEGFIGSSKLVFLNVDGSYDIINESLGHWDKGVWYSNSSYKSYSNIYGGYNYKTYDNIGSCGWSDDYLFDDDTDDFNSSFSRTTKNQEDLFKPRSTTISPKPDLKCEFCSDMVNSLSEVDINDPYDDVKQPTWLSICEECSNYEKDYYSGSNKSEKQFSLGGE